MNIQCVQQFCKCISIKIKFYLKIDNKIQNLFFISYPWLIAKNFSIRYIVNKYEGKRTNKHTEKNMHAMTFCIIYETVIFFLIKHVSHLNKNYNQ